jgi:hypothetical protein
MIRTNWLNLQDGRQEALMRDVIISAKDASGFFTIQAFSQDDQNAIDSFAVDSNTAIQDFAPDVRVRLLSLKMRWTIGEIESLTPEYLKVRMH